MIPIEEYLEAIIKASEETKKPVVIFGAHFCVGVRKWNVWTVLLDYHGALYILESLKIPLPYPGPSYGVIADCMVDLLNERTQLQRWFKMRAFK